jgi:hypothetical protein
MHVFGLNYPIIMMDDVMSTELVGGLVGEETGIALLRLVPCKNLVKIITKTGLLNIPVGNIFKHLRGRRMKIEGEGGEDVSELVGEGGEVHVHYVITRYFF